VATYDQAEIDALLRCPKTITDPPKRSTKLVNADYRNDMRLIASNGIGGEFAVFMRQSEDFPENFSVGLVYHPNDGRPEITLVRCNGQHGVYNGSPSQNPTHPHFGYHIHTATEEAQDAGFRAERTAVATAEFASYDEAVRHFVALVNIEESDRDRYFPKRQQPKLFD
jgi:hypothetical protein